MSSITPQFALFLLLNKFRMQKSYKNFLPENFAKANRAVRYANCAKNFYAKMYCTKFFKVNSL